MCIFFLAFDKPNQTTSKNLNKAKMSSAPKNRLNRELSKIETMTDKNYLTKLEKQYDKYLNKNQHLLMLLDTIYDYLDIRDAIRVRVQRLEIEEKRKTIYKNENEIKNENTKKYDRTFHLLIEPELRLTEEQISQGYAPCPDEPTEYKCGCASIRYYSLCKNKEKPTDINLQLYCETHIVKKKTHDDLENKLKKIKMELFEIKRKGNQVDLKTVNSKYPWKNIYPLKNTNLMKNNNAIKNTKPRKKQKT